MIPRTGFLLFSHRIPAYSGQRKRQRCCQVHPDRWSRSKRPRTEHSQSVGCFVGFISESKVRFMIRNHSTAVPGLTVSDVNFDISTTDFVFCKSGVLLFCIIRTPCPIKFWSPGHFVLIGAKKLCKTADGKAYLACSLFRY